MNTPDQFKPALAKHVKTVIRNLRAQGTQAMSADNLWQMSANGMSKLAGAPEGTNAAYFARQAFNDVCQAERTIAGFLL